MVRQKKDQGEQVTVDERLFHDLQGIWKNLGNVLSDLGNRRKDSRPFVGVKYDIIEPSTKLIGLGLYGTMVFEGTCGGRQVAVKRYLVGQLEIDEDIVKVILESLHTNVAHYYAVTHSSHFWYIAQERCKCTLHELISANLANYSGSRLDLIKIVDLWSANGYPSLKLLDLMRDVVSGIAHLHHLGIVHQNLKPGSILISHTLSAKVSNMGITRCTSKYDDVAANYYYRPLQWRAPEELSPGGHPTPATDMFSLGAILFFCVTGGSYAFGELNRNTTIDLSLVAFIPEAHDLISCLLSKDAESRPKASNVLHHPFFWSSEMRLSFLRVISDKLQNEGPNSQFLKAIENIGPQVFGVNWICKIDKPILTFLSNRRSYNRTSLKDLLRAVRNILNHYQDAKNQVKVILGSVPEGMDSYFAKLYPTLLMESYRVSSKFCRKDDLFQKYFQYLDKPQQKKKMKKKKKSVVSK